MWCAINLAKSCKTSNPNICVCNFWDGSPISVSKSFWSTVCKHMREQSYGDTYNLDVYLKYMSLCSLFVWRCMHGADVMHACSAQSMWLKRLCETCACIIFKQRNLNCWFSSKFCSWIERYFVPASWKFRRKHWWMHGPLFRRYPRTNFQVLLNSVLLLRRFFVCQIHD